MNPAMGTVAGKRLPIDFCALRHENEEFGESLGLDTSECQDGHPLNPHRQDVGRRLSTNEALLQMMHEQPVNLRPKTRKLIGV